MEAKLKARISISNTIEKRDKEGIVEYKYTLGRLLSLADQYFPGVNTRNKGIAYIQFAVFTEPEELLEKLKEMDEICKIRYDVDNNYFQIRFKQPLDPKFSKIEKAIKAWEFFGTGERWGVQIFQELEGTIEQLIEDKLSTFNYEDGQERPQRRGLKKKMLRKISDMIDHKAGRDKNNRNG